MTEATFKENLLKFGGIDSITGTIALRGNIRMLGNGSSIPQLTVRDIIVTGNAVVPGLSYDSLTVVGNVISTDGNFIGNGALMTGITSTLPAQANIDINGNTSGEYVNVHTLMANSGMIGNIKILGDDVHVRGHVHILGNASAGYFIGNGALLTGLLLLPSIANVDIVGNVTGAYANMDTVMATVGNVGNVGMKGGDVVTGGNITAEYFIGNGASLTGVLANLPSTVSVDIRGNVTGACATVENVIAISGNIGSVLVGGGNVDMSGYVAAGYFIGNGARLTGVLATLPQNASVDIRGNVTGAYANVGTIIAPVGFIGNTWLSGGGVSAEYFVGNGARLTGLTLTQNASVDIRGNVTGAYANVGTVIASNGNIGNVLMAEGGVSASEYIINDGFKLGYSFAGFPTMSFTHPSSIAVVGNYAAEGEEMWFSMGDTPPQMALNRQGTLRMRGINGANQPTYIGSSIQTNDITSTSGNVGNVVMKSGNITARRGNIGNVVIADNTVTAQNFVGNGALLTGINSLAKYLSVGRKTNQTISSGSWAKYDVLFDDIHAKSYIEYFPLTGIFKLEGGVTYRVTAQVGWKAFGEYFFAFNLFDLDNNVPVGPRAESLSATLSTYNTSSPVLDIIVTPETTTKYCIRIASDVTAGSGEQIRSDVGTFLTIVGIGGSGGFSSKREKVSKNTTGVVAHHVPRWTKVSNWNFGGTIVAPTPGTSAQREYSWSVSGKTLSMKGYYIVNSGDGATAGDGDYTLEIPPGHAINPSVIATSGSVRGIPVGQLTLYTATTQGTGVVLVHDSTHLKFAAGLAGSGPVEILSSTFAQLSTDAHSLYFSVDVPII